MPRRTVREERKRTEGDEPFRRAVALAEKPEDNFIELAQTLATLYQKDRLSLRRFIEHSAVKRRKAYYLLELGTRLPELKLPHDRLRGIGWTKLQVILRKLDRQGANKWLKNAESSSVQVLKDLVRGEATDAKQHCMLLYFSKRQYQQLERAILMNGGQRLGKGLANKEDAIMRMVHRLTRSHPRR